MRRTQTGELAREYCQRFPSAASRAIARMLRKDHPGAFSSFDASRAAVNYYRGTMGDKHRQNVERGGSLVPRTSTIPEADPPEYEVVHLPEDIGRWLLLYDTHFPYHDSEAVEIAVEWAAREENHCDGIILGGDIMDCYSLSTFVRDRRKRDFAAELEVVIDFIDALRSRLEPNELIWREGNHEYRLLRYLIRQAPELLGVKNFDLPSFMELDARGVRYIPWPNPLRYHALTILHGDEPGGGSSSVNPARTAFLKTHECCVVGHSHRTSQHTEKTLSDRTITCWSVGALCDLHPRYRPVNKWNHGFAVLDTVGGWHITNYRIVEGEVTT